MPLPNNVTPEEIRSIIGQSQIIRDGTTFTPIATTPYYIDSIESTSAIQSINGVKVNDEPSSEFLFGIYAGGNNFLGSSDGGITWTRIYGDPGSGQLDTQGDIVGDEAGSILWSTGGNVYGATGFGNMQINGSSVAINFADQDTGDLLSEPIGGPPPTTTGDDLPIRLAYDPDAGRWWAGGSTASNTRSLAYKTTSLSVSTGWTTVVGGPIDHIRSMVIGPEDETGTLTLSYVDGTNLIRVPSVNANISNISDLNANITGWSGRNCRNLVYNAFWNKYMVVGDAVRYNGTDPSCLVASPENFGSEVTADYERPIAGNSIGANSVQLQDGGAAVAVGPWCYFATDKGGSGSGIIGTPDMGYTWYHKDFYGRQDVDADHSYINGMGKYDGRLVFVVGRIGFSKSTIYMTPRLEMPRPVGWV